MAATPSERNVEWSVEEFLTERCAVLGRSDVSDLLYSQAGNLRLMLLALHVFAAGCGIFALLAALVTVIRLVDTSGASSAAHLALLAFWLVVIVAAIRASHLVRHRTMLTAGRQYDIADSETFADIFEPVLDGVSFKIGVVADDGGGIAITSKTRRAIGRYLGVQAFDDRAFPATILQRTDRTAASKFRLLKASAPQFVILATDSGRPLGDWLSYYLWLLTEPDVLELFDAAEVYPGDEVRRLRARVAVLAIRELVQERLNTNDLKKRKSLLKKRVTDRLKLDAAIRLQSGEITELQARQLEKLNMGDSISIKKPEAWVNNLASGDYPTILDPILTVARQRRGDFAVYKRRK